MLKHKWVFQTKHILNVNATMQMFKKHRRLKSSVAYLTDKLIQINTFSFTLVFKNENLKNDTLVPVLCPNR